MEGPVKSLKPVALVWSTDPLPRRRATPTSAEMAAAGVRIADEEGLDAVTMRHLAEVLGTGTTSLYRYVAGKEELIERMLDAAYADQADGLALTGDWRTDLRAIARIGRATTLRHPWLTDRRFHRPAFGPNSLARMEQALSAAAGVSSDSTTVYLALTAVLDFVAGSTARQLAERNAQQESGLDWVQWQASLAPLIRTIVTEGKYPHLNQRVLDADEIDFDTQFEFGLDCVINGIDRMGVHDKSPGRKGT
jgi:AcrR family transcriptional regulator